MKSGRKHKEFLELAKKVQTIADRLQISANSKPGCEAHFVTDPACELCARAALEACGTIIRDQSELVALLQGQLREQLKAIDDLLKTRDLLLGAMSIREATKSPYRPTGGKVVKQ